MSRKATMAPTQRVLLTKLHSFPGGHDPYGWATSPRMANRQLKLLWCSLMTSTMDSVLKRLQQILRSSKGGAKWTSAFCCLLGLAMCFEYMQRMAHVVCDDPTVKGVATTQDMECRAEAACRAIDDKFLFVNNLFRWKYHRGFNPLRDYKDEKVQRTLGENALEFVRSVNGLMAEKCKCSIDAFQCTIANAVLLQTTVSYTTASTSASRRRTRKSTRRGWSHASSPPFPIRSSVISLDDPDAFRSRTSPGRLSFPFLSFQAKHSCSPTHFLSFLRFPPSMHRAVKKARDGLPHHVARMHRLNHVMIAFFPSFFLSNA